MEVQGIHPRAMKGLGGCRGSESAARGLSSLSRVLCGSSSDPWVPAFQRFPEIPHGRRRGKDLGPHPQSIFDPLDTENFRMFLVQLSLSVQGRSVSGSLRMPKFSDPLALA